MLRKFSFKKHIEIEFHLNSSTQLFTLLQQLNKEAKFSMKIHAKQKLFTHCCSFALFSYTVIRYSAQFVTIELYVCVLLLFLWLYDYVFYVWKEWWKSKAQKLSTENTVSHLLDMSWNSSYSTCACHNHKA